MEIDFEQIGEDVLLTLQNIASVLVFGIWCECFCMVFLR